MGTDFGKLKKNKIFRGAYNYYRSNNIYSEETFDVFKDKKELGLNFFSQIHSRVSTGELLTIDVVYIVNKNYIPQLVIISRALGKDNVEEVFDFDNKKNLLNYTFKSTDEEISKTLSTPPKFHVATPSCANSMLYLRSKKFDATTKNYYTVIASHNQWKFESEPSNKTIGVQRISLASENVSIDGHNVQAVQYRLFEFHEGSAEDPKDFVKVFLSQYITIPYILRTDDQTRIQIKYLNNLSDEH